MLISLNAIKNKIFFFILLMTAPTLYLVVDNKIEMAVEAKDFETLPLLCLELNYFPCIQRLRTNLATGCSFSFSEYGGYLDSRCFVWCSESAEAQTSRCFVWCSEIAESQTSRCFFWGSENAETQNSRCLFSVLKVQRHRLRGVLYGVLKVRRHRLRGVLFGVLKVRRHRL
jgi:hypothetical protein